MVGSGTPVERDAALRRGRRITASLAAAGVALTAAFAGVAAVTRPGHAAGTQATVSGSSSADTSGDSSGTGPSTDGLQAPGQLPTSGGAGGFGGFGTGFGRGGSHVTSGGS